MFTCPKTPTLEELKAFRCSSEAVNLALRLRRDLKHTIGTMRPEILLAFALQGFPDETPEQAIKKFGLEAMATLQELSILDRDMHALQKAESDRLEPLTLSAAIRRSSIVGRLKGMPREIELAKAAVQRKRKELAALDIQDPAVIEKLAPADGVQALEDECRALEAESAALEAFIKSGDETLLPPGIKPFDRAALGEARRLERQHHLQQTVGGVTAAA